MTKSERYLNNIWNYLQKISSKEVLEKLNMRAFLYSVGRLTKERCLLELALTFLGIDLQSNEVKTLFEIMEGKNNDR